MKAQNNKAWASRWVLFMTGLSLVFSSGLLLFSPGLVHAEEMTAHLRGVVMPIQQSKLSFSQTGVITELPREGMLVKKGQIIARVDESSARVALVKAKASHANAKLGLEQAEHEKAKTQRLKGESIVSDMALKEVEYTIRSAKIAVTLAQADIDTARANLHGCRLKAPFDGVVALVTSNMGEWIGAGTPVLELADTSALQLGVDLIPQQVLALKTGMKTDVLDSGRQVGTAIIERILPFIDPASGLQQVVWSVKPLKGEALSGRYVNLKKSW
ncbi:MAG: efflux RND transporter periplasmic adaptor subunit [Magnetococcales bacterium]|nr:efflux RND transporter periplasmic adaptor subunit [Magnetococcales bacterium]